MKDLAGGQKSPRGQDIGSIQISSKAKAKQIGDVINPKRELKDQYNVNLKAFS